MGILEGILYMMWRGIAIGIIISAPMGPVGILCIQRTLEKGRRAGLYTGVGAAISDLFYCLLTGFGLSFIEDFLERNQNIIQLIGSVVLIGFGAYLFRSNPARKLRKPDSNRDSLRMNILNGFLFTFSNPLIIFLIIGLFARFNFMLPEITFYHYIIGFICIFTGALLWWYFVTFFVAKVRAHFNLRSMWLINKIIGSIILIFAVVGIVTGVIGLCNAQTREPVIRLKATDISAESEAIKSGSDFVLTFRNRNLSNNPLTNSYRPWGIRLLGPDGDSYDITISTGEDINEYDNNSARMFFSADGCQKHSIDKGVDLYKGANAFRLTCRDGAFSLETGNREYLQALEGTIPLKGVDSICFIASPGVSTEFSNIELQKISSPGILKKTVYGDAEVLQSYLARSRDAREGIWRMFDRSFDEDLLRMGGSYTLAMIGAGDGTYELIYLDGAIKNARAWSPGMVKALMKPTGFNDIFDIVWYDSEGLPVSNEIKGQYADGTLSISFPYHNSELRLRRLEGKPHLNSVMPGGNTGKN